MLVVNYEVNKTSIAKKYCENKAKPKMHCDGKCHLKKQLKKEEKREKSPFSENQKEQYEVQFFVEDSALNNNLDFPNVGNNPVDYSCSISTVDPNKIFQPPKC